MPGGLMQLVSQGQQNIVLNGNPTKSFFKSVFHQKLYVFQKSLHLHLK